MSATPVVWILCSEIQPLKCRDFGITCSTTTYWVANMIIGALGTFWLYTGFNLVFIVITVYLVPETKNVTPERIERNLMSGEKLRDLGR